MLNKKISIQFKSNCLILQLNTSDLLTLSDHFGRDLFLGFDRDLDSA